MVNHLINMGKTRLQILVEYTFVCQPNFAANDSNIDMKNFVEMSIYTQYMKLSIYTQG